MLKRIEPIKHGGVVRLLPHPVSLDGFLDVEGCCGDVVALCEEFREKGVDAVSQLDVLSLVCLVVELARQAQCLKGEVAADEAVDMAECVR